MPHPVFRSTSTALITGAASGIGLAIAQLCARHSMKLALVDKSPETLATAKSALVADVEAETFRADVSKLEDWRELKVAVGKRFGGVHLLVLNAGIGEKGGWEDVGYFRRVRIPSRWKEEMMPRRRSMPRLSICYPTRSRANFSRQIFDTNLFGALNGISTFLPTLKSLSSSSGTAIVITGSKQGITNPPSNPAYNASKAALRSAAEHLSYDLRSTSTTVHLLIPGWTFTGMTGGGNTAVRDKPAGAWEPRQVAEELEKAMEEGRFYVMCPDNDVSADLDKRRVLWGAGDLVEGRPPLSRWREDWKEKAEEGIREMALPGKEPEGEEE